MSNKYVYLITNKVNGKQYVGITYSFKRRFYEHKNARSTSKCILQDAIKKYGSDNFNFQVLCLTTQDHAQYVEKDLIAKLGTQVPNGYNISPGGEQGPEPFKKVTSVLLECWADDFKNPNLTNADLKAKYKVSACTVRQARLGITYGGVFRLHGYVEIAKSNKSHGKVRGEVVGSSKLKDSEVLEIYLSNDKGVNLSNKYGVTTSVISCIRNGKIWKHVTEGISRPAGTLEKQNKVSETKWPKRCKLKREDKALIQDTSLSDMQVSRLLGVTPDAISQARKGTTFEGYFKINIQEETK